MRTTFEADSIQLAFNGRPVLSDVYIRASAGSVTGLLGRNGSGKSSLMKIMHGTMPCEKSVRINGMAQHHAYRRPDLLRYLPQFNFIPGSLLLERVFHDFELDYSPFASRFTPFASRFRSSIKTLSGGERRLVELYVIVKSSTAFVLLDEPFTHLNPLQIEAVKELLLEEKSHKGMIITDHLFRHVLEIADATYVLKDGKTHLAKTPEDVEDLGYARI
jgi:ABC-type lipopolysaccharide export system ATPase subunit